VAGNWVVGDKLDEYDGLTFVNSYRRLAGNQDVNGLEITKNVTGQYANLDTSFSFTLNLTQHTLAPLTFPITAHIVNADNTTTAANITSATQTFNLTHGQRLVVPALYAGTTWNVTEAAHAEFAPRVNVIVGGTQVHSVTDAAPNTALSSGDRLVHDTGRNAADFTNAHQFMPPTGLDIANAPFIAAALVLIALALLLASRKRREIESMPVV
jgi:LPXTG-motif cell wall-anchored protein